RDAAAVDEVEDRAVDAGAVLLAVPAAHTALAALAGGATLTWCNTANLSGRPALATLTALALSLSLSLVLSLVLSLALSLTLALGPRLVPALDLDPGSGPGRAGRGPRPGRGKARRWPVVRELPQTPTGHRSKPRRALPSPRRCRRGPGRKPLWRAGRTVSGCHWPGRRRALEVVRPSPGAPARRGRQAIWRVRRTGMRGRDHPEVLAVGGSGPGPDPGRQPSGRGMSGRAWRGEKRRSCRVPAVPLRESRTGAVPWPVGGAVRRVPPSPPPPTVRLRLQSCRRSRPPFRWPWRDRLRARALRRAGGEGRRRRRLRQPGRAVEGWRLQHEWGWPGAERPWRRSRRRVSGSGRGLRPIRQRTRGRSSGRP